MPHVRSFDFSKRRNDAASVSGARGSVVRKPLQTLHMHVAGKRKGRAFSCEHSAAACAHRRVVRMKKNASQSFCDVNVHPLQPVVGASENKGLRCQVVMPLDHDARAIPA